MKPDIIRAPDCWEEIPHEEWLRRNQSVTPGVYRAKIEVPVPGKPDGRIRNDWRNANVPTGALVYVTRDREGTATITVYTGESFPRPVGPGSAWFLPLAAALGAADDPDGRFCALWFRYYQFDRPPLWGSAARALRWLWEQKIVTDDQVLAALRSGDEEDLVTAGGASAVPPGEKP